MATAALSQPVADALAVAVVNACDEALSIAHDEARFPDPSVTAQSIAAVVLAVVHKSLASFALRLNEAAAPTRRLPPELWCAVFDFLSVHDCISASHVCTAWRTTILTCAPAIWSGVSCYNRPDGALTALLERSASADLKLEVKANSDNWLEVARCLEAHLYRCTYLKVVLSDALPHDAADAVTAALCRPAPRLRTFKLFDRIQQFNRLKSPDARVFGGYAPLLELVKMHSDIGAFPPSDALSGVRRLLYANTGDAGLRNVQDVVERFPGLDGLAVEMDGWTGPVPADKDADSGRARPLALPSALKYLAVIANLVSVDAGALLPHVDTEPVRHVTVSYNKPAPADDAAGVLRQLADGALVTAMRIQHSSYSDALNVEVWHADERHRSVLDLPHDARPGAALFAHLTILSVGETVLTLGAPFPAAPALATLSVLLLPAADQAEHGQASVFLLPRTRERVFACPALHALLLVGAPADGLTRVAPEVVREFVEFHLEFDAPQLDSLTLRGATLMEDCVDEVARLLDTTRHFMVEVAPADSSVRQTTTSYNPLLTWQ